MASKPVFSTVSTVLDGEFIPGTTMKIENVMTIRKTGEHHRTNVMTGKFVEQDVNDDGRPYLYFADAEINGHEMGLAGIPSANFIREGSIVTVPPRADGVPSRHGDNAEWEVLSLTEYGTAWLRLVGGAEGDTCGAITGKLWLA